MKDFSAGARRFVTTGKSCGAIGASFIEIERSFGTICETALLRLKSPATEMKFAVIGQSWHAIAGNSGAIAVGTVTTGIVIAADGMIATAGGILINNKIAAQVIPEAFPRKAGFEPAFFCYDCSI